MVLLEGQETRANTHDKLFPAEGSKVAHEPLEGVTLAYITFIPVASTVLLGGLFLIITHLKFFSLSKRHRVGRPFMFQLFRTNAKFV